MFDLSKIGLLSQFLIGWFIVIHCLLLVFYKAPTTANAFKFSHPKSSSACPLATGCPVLKMRKALPIHSNLLHSKR